MNKLWLVLLAGMSSVGFAQGIVGKWQTIDDETKKPKGVVEIVASGGAFQGRVTQLYEGSLNQCTGCTGAQKDGPIIGMTVVSGLKETKDGQYEGGKVFDPKSGKTYSAKAKLINNGQSLELRGFVGVSLLGRTQTWKRLN
ncbi:MAG: DUF2147 domain-containing protein [Neisseriaceae bacterium]|nr:DUF2147 domain-containing protein [Neisseriaceae bacterium]MBP6861985.1 DUF2147 domain-containing protein [Neisseriaceae bacterium]